VKICNGSAGDGLSKAVFQNRFPKAVKRSGAVSPPIRANASKMPVMMPLDARLHYNMDDVCHRADTECRARLRDNHWNQQNDFFGRAKDELESLISASARPPQGRKAFEPQYDQTVKRPRPR